MIGSGLRRLVVSLTAAVVGAAGPAGSAIASTQIVDATLPASVSVSTVTPAHEPAGFGTGGVTSVTGVLRVSANAPWVLTATAGPELKNMEAFARARSTHNGRDRLFRTRLDASDRVLACAGSAGTWVVALDIAMPTTGNAPPAEPSGPGRALILTLSPAL